MAAFLVGLVQLLHHVRGHDLPGGIPGGLNQFEGGDFSMAASGDFLMAADRPSCGHGPDDGRWPRSTIPVVRVRGPPRLLPV